ncbi:cysteine hydrolase family protein [Virgibacillus oceani]|uniref:Isochorismatase n=1 Tax=Virgibacillus oceani TaxID=1479511 RepID=A0A917HIM8_9BACI|nr:cysteine hydrolase family protein [Virgibacillus oceani]GGG80537.1 isochorismatase [Virgibacillus oceani]
MNQALLVIDAQSDLINGSKEEKGVINQQQLLANINSVIKEALREQALIVFVRDLDISEGKGKGFQVHEAIHVPEQAKIFNKEATNSFHGTGLKSYLEENQIEHLVIMGCQTEHCIDTAVRTATVNGFDVTLVGDGHSTSDKTVLNAQQIIDHHNHTLHGHYKVEHFSIVRKADEDLFKPIHDTYR